MDSVTNLPVIPARNWKEAIAALFGATGLLLLTVYAAHSFLDQLLTDMIQQELMNPRGTSNWIWVFGGLSFALGLIGPLIVSFLALCAWRFPQVPLGDVARRHFSYLVREEMRVLGSSLLWGILLLIPGIIRFFQCTFVSYVVLLDPDYSLGTTDALQLSQLRVRQVWGRLAILFIIFGAILPLVLTALDEWRSIFQQPLTALPLLLVELTILLLFQWLILRAWEKASRSTPLANPASSSGEVVG